MSSEEISKDMEEASSSGDGGGKLFLGGLSWDTTEEKLREHFGVYGDIHEAVVMKDRTTGRPRGFGFVTFKDAEVADRVVQDIHVIDGRQIDAKKSVPQEQKPKARKIFVGGLAPETTEADFKEYFERYGSISDVQIMQDHMTGRSRGFGFITFEEDAAVEKVFAQGAMQELGGKRIEIKHATPKGSSSPTTPGVRSSSGGRGQGYGRAMPMPFGQLTGSPYGYGLFHFPPGVMPHATPYSMGYANPYLMMQQISGYPGATPYPFAGLYGGQGRGASQQLQQAQHTSQQLSSSGAGPVTRLQGQQQQMPGQGSRQQHPQAPYPRPLAGSGRGKGKVDSASELSNHHHSAAHS